MPIAIAITIPLVTGLAGALVLSAVAVLSGWSEAARQFRLGELPPSVRTTRYRRVWLRRRTATLTWVLVGSDREFIYFVPSWPFRAFLIPLRLPRSEVLVEHENGWLKLTVRGLRLDAYLTDSADARAHWMTTTPAEPGG